MRSRPSTTEMLHQVQEHFSLLPPVITARALGHSLDWLWCRLLQLLYAKIVAEHIWSQCFKDDPLSRNAGENVVKSCCDMVGPKIERNFEGFAWRCQVSMRWWTHTLMRGNRPEIGSVSSFPSVNSTNFQKYNQKNDFCLNMTKLGPPPPVLDYY